MSTYDAWFPRYALRNRLMFFCRPFSPTVGRGSSALSTLLDCCTQRVKQVIIPANIDNIELEIVADVVNCEIPLFLSKQFMKDADSTLDFVSDCITMYGK